MVGRSFIYDVNCPKCSHNIKNDSYDNMMTYRYRGDFVVIEQCPICGKEFLVKLDKIIVPKMDYEVCYPFMKEKYTFAVINENLFERLKEEQVFITEKKDLCIEKFSPSELTVVMY